MHKVWSSGQKTEMRKLHAWNTHEYIYFFNSLSAMQHIKQALVYKGLHSFYAPNFSFPRNFSIRTCILGSVHRFLSFISTSSSIHFVFSSCLCFSYTGQSMITWCTSSVTPHPCRHDASSHCPIRCLRNLKGPLLQAGLFSNLVVCLEYIKRGSFTCFHSG